MWIIFGTADKTRRVPGGARVERHCDQCGETTTFYEKEILSSFRLYFIDIFDYGRQRVMACGGCGTCYATDELGPGVHAEEAKGLERTTMKSLGEGVEKAAQRAGDFLERAADAVENKVSALVSGDRERERVAEPPRSEAPLRTPEEEELDVDDLEKRFQELEEKEKRIRIG